MSIILFLSCKHLCVCDKGVHNKRRFDDDDDDDDDMRHNRNKIPAMDVASVNCLKSVTLNQFTLRYVTMLWMLQHGW